MGKIMRNGIQYGVDTADVLSTVAECDASASGGKGTTQVASAKALSELNSNFEEELGSRLGGLTFGIDAEGNYGYIKVGADTVTPFSKSVVSKIIPTTDIKFNCNFLIITGTYAELINTSPDWNASKCYILDTKKNTGIKTYTMTNVYGTGARIQGIWSNTVVVDFDNKTIRENLGHSSYQSSKYYEI